MATVCGFCGLKLKSEADISKQCIEHEGRSVPAIEGLKIFRADLIEFVGQHSKANICIKCLRQLHSCYKFIQKVLNARKHILKTINRDVPVENSKRLQHILPKLKEGSFDSVLIASKSKASRVYKCSECPCSFSSFRQLKLHENLHAIKDINAAICQYCNSLYDNEEQLQQHEAEAHPDRRYSCLPCSKYYKTKGQLLKHVSNIHQVSELLYYCALCTTGVKPLEFPSQTALQGHFQQIHAALSSTQEEDEHMEMNAEFLDEFLLSTANENSFQFTECWDALDLHLSDVLPINNSSRTSNSAPDDKLSAFKCPKCFAGYSNQKTLMLHLANVHSLNVLICNKCEASFNNIIELKEHKSRQCPRTNLLKNSLACEVCDKMFKSVAACNYHAKIHMRTTTRPHECPFCGKQFHGHANIKQHLRTVHAQVKRHICQLCDKQFATLDHLKKHVLSQHQNERKHICHVCAKSFTQLCHLKQHLAIHTTGKSFQCEICDEKFWKKFDLERHIINKHE